MTLLEKPTELTPTFVGAASGVPRRHLALLWFAAVAAPLFVHAGEFGLGPAIPFRIANSVYGTHLPLLLPVVAAITVLVVALSKSTLGRATEDQLLLGLIVIFSTAATVGLFVRDNSNPSLSVSYFAQTVLPMQGYVVGRIVGAGSHRAWSSGLLIYARVVATAAAALIIYSPFAYVDPLVGYTESIGPWTIAEPVRFFPTAVSIAVAILACHAFLSGRRIRFGSIALALPSVYLITVAHSRAALIALIVTAGLVTAHRRKAMGTHSPLAAPLAVIFVALAFPLAVVSGAVDFSGGSVNAVTRLVSGSSTDGLKFQRSIDATVEGFSNPLGNAFVADEQIIGFGGATRIARSGTAENQFSEYALRAGPLAGVVFLVLIARTAADMFRTRRNRAEAVQWGDSALVVLFVGFCVIGGLLQINYTQVYVAPITWAIVGLSVSRFSIK